ncbi:hypothetical protein R1flu_013417 [Riccia fluitans]|uniref:Uncharacterized protein n=1 Tax=Riccia fluitans TaxID=41844 RepID=A0ABD1YDH9_9MARC
MPDSTSSLTSTTGPGGQDKDQQFTATTSATHASSIRPSTRELTKFLGWITETRHTNNNFGNMGDIEVMNEPRPQTDSEKQSLLNEYYPNAYNRIRTVEDLLGITPSNRLHIQFMDTRRREGNPVQLLGSAPYFSMFDGHKYLHRDKVCLPFVMLTSSTLALMTLVPVPTVATIL